MEFKELPISAESKRFKEHLLLESNDRIIFSGIFGIGKTYFLEKFFKTNENDFITIKLSPVNYSVSQNEDIFELIKFDIGFQLFSKNPNFEKIDFSYNSLSEFYIIENYKAIIVDLINSLSKIEKNLGMVIEPIMSLGNKINEFQNKVNIDERKELYEFLNTSKNRKGFPIEENNITDLINSLIDTLKTTYSEKKIILIIDDLDRIDPEHIFRVMNIFSTHFDYYDSGENKFGFDKVILVCDIDNIRGIFHNKYGTEIDFSGYIDKFYSIGIYEYNFRPIIVEYLNEYFKNVKLNSSDFKTALSSESNYITNELSFLLTQFIYANTLSMRNLVNSLKSNLDISTYEFQLTPLHTIYSQKTPTLLILEFMESIFGGFLNFSNAVKKATQVYEYFKFNTYDSYLNMTIGNLVMLVDNKNNKLKISNDFYTYINFDLDIKIVYKINHYGDYSVIGDAYKILGAKEENVESDSSLRDLSFERFPYFQILNLALNAKRGLKNKYYSKN